MNEIEKVDKLREKVNCSYADAKRALEASDWDILDAVIFLESEGKTPIETTQYTSREERSSADSKKNDIPKGESFFEVLARFGRWLLKVFKLGNANFFAVSKNDEEVFAVPITVFVVITAFCFYAVIPLLIIGLFFSLHYSFRGPNLDKTTINSVIQKAADAATEIKDEIINAAKSNDKSGDKTNDKPNDEPRGEDKSSGQSEAQE